MKKNQFIVGVLVVYSIFFWLMPGYFQHSLILQKWANGTQDILFRIRHSSDRSHLPKPPVVLVSIDDESCEKLGARWPWSRTVFAQLVESLAKRGATTIALNFTFTGFEDGEGKTTQALAEAVQAHGNVLVGATFDHDKLIKPSPYLLNAKAHYGYLEKIVDEDYVIRRSYLARPYTVRSATMSTTMVARWENSFPLELAKISLAKKGFRIETDPLTGALIAGFPGHQGPLNSDGSYPINFLYDESDFVQVPAWKVVQNRLQGLDLKGKVVLVGITSSLLSEKHSTPLGLMPGVTVHANEYSSLAIGRHLRTVSPSISFIVSWILSVAILSLLLWRFFWIALVAFLTSIVGIFLACQIGFSGDWAVQPFILLFGPLTGVIAGVLADLLHLWLENRHLEHKVLHDKMTGLYTYDYLRMRLDDEWKRCQKLQLPVSVVMTDLDRFKKINDTLGHEVGNQMILRAADVIRESVRGYDVVSRYGGDEFVILLWHAHAAEAEAYRQRLRQMYADMASKLEDDFLKTSSISIGFASYDPKAGEAAFKNPQELIEAADKHLFEDKESRRKPGEARR